MPKNLFKDRIIVPIKQKSMKIKEPYIQQERPSLKGRIHPLPKTAFWQRMSGWPMTQPEETTL
ncbi:MAG: hypothetical protein JSS10_01040 [Verrucomicrobia bacterium]|nr:hypothetical protein [Verrucomicrobiota bacterium]